MNWVDVIVLVILAVATYSSLRTGFLRQALALIGFVVGIYAALTHRDTVANTLLRPIQDPSVSTFVAFILILIAVWFAFAVLARMARAALNAAGLVWTDHFMGMLVGLLAGLFFTVGLLLLLVRIPFLGISDAVNDSALASLIFQILPHLRQLFPADLRIFSEL
jgi:membrane protein required for colicin V production